MVAFQQSYIIVGMSKLSARWVPKSLSDEQMQRFVEGFRSKDEFLSSGDYR